MRHGFLLLAAAGLTAAAAGCGQSVTRDDDNLVAGKVAFVGKCGSCHTLARAGTKGTVGPNLDDAFRRSLRDGLGRTTIRGVVHEQILYPADLKDHSTGTQMPPKLVTGQDAEDVAAYVAFVAARGGKDTGLLADAVKQAGGGEPAVAENGVLQIDADPSGQLAFSTKEAQAPAGAITIKMENKSGVPHDIALEGDGKGPVVEKGVSQFKTTLKAGKIKFFCSVPGHREGGMEGTLTVK